MVVWKSTAETKVFRLEKRFEKIKKVVDKRKRS